MNKSPRSAQKQKRVGEAASANGAQPPAHAPSASTVTMADVAAVLGVSKMTVSRALNRSDARSRGPSEALRQKILKTCQEMGYVLDLNARTFASKRSGIVAALIPALNNSNFSDTAHGLTAVVESSGMQVLLGDTDYSIEREERLLKAMLARRPEAIVVTGGHHSPSARKMLKTANVPIVETWDLLPEPIQHVVGFSNAEAVGAMVRAMHAKGYRQIGFLGGIPQSDARGADRRRGFEMAMRALGLDASRSVSIGNAPVSMAAGAQGIVQLLTQWPDLQAVVCVSDHAAFGALSECQRRGWSVPDRIAIAGFGGFEVSAACHPQLSTVVVDSYGIGRATGDLLLRAIPKHRLSEAFANETIIIPYRVELRGST